MAASKYIFLVGIVVLCVLGVNGVPEADIETEIFKKHHHHHHHHHHHEDKEILLFEASPAAGKAAVAVEAGLAELGLAAGAIGVEGEKILVAVLKPVITFLNALAIKIGVLAKGLWGVLVLDFWAGIQKISLIVVEFLTAIGLTAIKTGALAPLIKAIITYYDLVAEKLAILWAGLGDVIFVDALIGLQKVGVLVAEFWAVAGAKKLL